MTDKELRKLSRQDLLQLLIAQGREAASIEEQLKEAKYNEQRQFDSNERLRDRIADREETIEHLKEKLTGKDEKLNEKDREIAELKDQIAMLKANGFSADGSGMIDGNRPLGSIAEAALALNDVFAAAQKAADMYIANAKRIAEGDN
ncbi:MAG: hypothetical protein IKR35_03445 [Lachnospiraceae bacterium]|nr:hypothetical protein [Lachnospiraceae bacterium]MBR6302885.1 hypothetical protein [Lachnospiraceae bacterium]